MNTCRTTPFSQTKCDQSNADSTSSLTLVRNGFRSSDRNEKLDRTPPMTLSGVPKLMVQSFGRQHIVFCSERHSRGEACTIACKLGERTEVVSRPFQGQRVDNGKPADACDRNRPRQNRARAHSAGRPLTCITRSNLRNGGRVRLQNEKQTRKPGN